MTIQSVPESAFPDFGRYFSKSAANVTTLSLATQAISLLDTANEAFCYVGDAPVAGDIEAVYWKTGTVSCTAGPLNVDVRIEQLTNGRPNGTLWATNSNILTAVADTDDNVAKTSTLTAVATVTLGQPFGIVWKAPAAGTFSFTQAGTTAQGLILVPGGYPQLRADTNSDGAYEAQVTTGNICLAVKISGTIYPMQQCAWWTSGAQTAYNNTSTPDERAMRWYSAVPRRVLGMRALMSNVAAAGDFIYSIWPDSAGTQTDADALAQVLTDGDIMHTTTADAWVSRYFPSKVTLAANTVYRAGVRAESANNIALNVANIISGFEGLPPGGAQCYSCTRSWTAGSAPAFTNDLTSVPLVELIYDGLGDDAGGASGVKYRANMSMS